MILCGNQSDIDELREMISQQIEIGQLRANNRLR